MEKINSILAWTFNKRPAKKTVIEIITLLTIINLGYGCKKLVDVDPPSTSLTSGNVYANNASATAVMSGIYSDISAGKSNVFGSTGIPILTGLSADEFTLWSGVTNGQQNNFYRNQLSYTTNGFEFWTGMYQYVFKCNDAIQGLAASSTLSPPVKTQLIAEAKFMRAYYYFILTNLYGDVPLTLTTDYTVNASLARTTQSQVLAQIVQDLTDAQNNLSGIYTDASLTTASTDRLRPTRWAATALLARLYLFMKDYPNAEKQASILINNTGLFSLSSLANAFLKASSGNKEAIWQVQPTNNIGANTLPDAQFFTIPATGPSSLAPVALSNILLSSFESGDNRQAVWVGSLTASGATYYYPNKYHVVLIGGTITQYLTPFRLGEQYLIRAEAEVYNGETTNAVNDLNAIRARAGLGNYSGSNDNMSLLTAILHERQVELFSEGFRWMDIKRTGKVDAVMTAAASQKGTTWNSYQQLYPVPLGDIQKDPNLTQNTGY